jgi:hypothetical protein
MTDGKEHGQGELAVGQAPQATRSPPPATVHGHQRRPQEKVQGEILLGQRRSSSSSSSCLGPGGGGSRRPAGALDVIYILDGLRFAYLPRLIPVRERR